MKSVQTACLCVLVLYWVKLISRIPKFTKVSGAIYTYTWDVHYLGVRALVILPLPSSPTHPTPHTSLSFSHPTLVQVVNTFVCVSINIPTHKTQTHTILFIHSKHKHKLSVRFLWGFISLSLSLWEKLRCCYIRNICVCSCWYSCTSGPFMYIT